MAAAIGRARSRFGARPPGVKVPRGRVPPWRQLFRGRFSIRERIFVVRHRVLCVDAPGNPTGGPAAGGSCQAPRWRRIFSTTRGSSMDCYLRASRIEHGLLINFGAPKFEIKKYVLSQIGEGNRVGGPLGGVLSFFASLVPFRGLFLPGF